MSGLTPRLVAALQQASALMNARRHGEARELLAPVAKAAPASFDARFLFGAALRHTGDPSGAERELRAAIALDPSREEAALELARLLGALGRHAELLAATETAAARPKPRQPLLTERARALAALGDGAGALALRERIAALYPSDAKAHHNLAGALGDAGLSARAEAAARQALARGGDAPETWLVLARALQGQNRLDQADAAFAEALRRRPLYADALRDRAQLVWMRSGDLAAAAAVIEEATGAAARDEARRLRAVLARLYDNAGEARAGYDLLVAGGIAGDAALEIAAADLSLRWDAPRALSHARRAERLAPGDGAVQRKLIDALLANGEAADALGRIGAARASEPDDQALIAAQWTAWRLLGDSRANALYDYQSLVRAETIAVPAGWPDLDAYLEELAATLQRLHLFDAHPFDQSLRGGTQTSVNLLSSEEPAIRAFVGAIDAPIRHYLRAVGTGPDPLRSRNCGAYRLSGMWSVRLRARGFHVDHVHPLGWLSSAFYVALPEQRDGQEGWIRFGEPGTPTQPQLRAEHHVEPAAGRLVIFPSYMWHGTVPFAGRGERLTLAFDAMPI